MNEVTQQNAELIEEASAATQSIAPQTQSLRETVVFLTVGETGQSASGKIKSQSQSRLPTQKESVMAQLDDIALPAEYHSELLQLANAILATLSHESAAFQQSHRITLKHQADPLAVDWRNSRWTSAAGSSGFGSSHRNVDAAQPRAGDYLSNVPAEPDRSRTTPPTLNKQNPLAPSADGIPRLEAKSQPPAFVERICLMLFDRWCEQRNVLALAYLMHVWPLTADDPSLVKRLLRSLHELREYHHEALLNEDFKLLGLLLDAE